MASKKKQEKLQNNKKHREEIEKIILEKEKEGGEAFHTDVEIDPPSRPINPEEVDYLQKKISTKIKTFIALLFTKKLYRMVKKTNQLEVRGAENLKDVKSGAIITGNHFHYFESGNAMEVCYRLPNKPRLYKIVKEGNFFMKGFFGFLLKNSNTLPLSSNMKTMIKLNHSISTILKRGDCILIYPEQAMWWNYRKPRPHKEGASYYAAKNNVPIVSYFVTMEDLDTLDDNGEPNQKYILNILPPIYPDQSKSIKENEAWMSQKNYEDWVRVYESFYHKKLVYLYEKKECEEGI